jgi:hypothetical protein
MPHPGEVVRQSKRQEEGEGEQHDKRHQRDPRQQAERQVLVTLPLYVILIIIREVVYVQLAARQVVRHVEIVVAAGLVDGDRAVSRDSQ